MKMFKKLMAVALAGVMALAVLTGCANVVGKKEVVNYLNDTKALATANKRVVHTCGSGEHQGYYEEIVQVRTGVKTIEQGDNKLAQEVLNKVAIYAKNHSVKNYVTEAAVAQSVLSKVGSKDDVAEIAKIVPDKSEDAYYVSFVEVTKFQSKEYQNNRDAMIAEQLSAPVALNDVDVATLGDKAVASVATKEIGGNTYLVVVYVQAKK